VTGGELERDRLDQVGFAVVFDLVDQFFADRVDHFRFPLRQGALPEGLGDQAAMVVVLLAMHAKNGRAEHQPDGLVVHLRPVHVVIAEGREDAFEVEEGPLFGGRQPGRRHGRVHERAAPHRLCLAHVLEEAVWIARQIRGPRLVVRIGADRHLCLPGQQRLATLQHYLYYFRYSRSRKTEGT
jgi:hypothetical protein